MQGSARGGIGVWAVCVLVLGAGDAYGAAPEPAAAAAPASSAPPAAAARAALLEDLTWQQAEAVLTPDTVVVLPLGAASKEHGPHLRLDNDLRMADYLKRRVLAAPPARVVVAPTLGYGFYPAFVSYPGATSLRLETARDLVVDVCRGLARFGPRRFYVLNTGVSTLRALRPAAEVLAQDGITLAYLDLIAALGPIEKQVAQQEGGTHADEIETSMMLYIAPERVDLGRAVRDYHPQRPGGFTRDPGAATGTYSPTGTWGDPTLATREKGARVVEHLVGVVAAQIRALAAAPPKTPAPSP